MSAARCRDCARLLSLIAGLACTTRAPLPPVSAPLTPTPDAAFRSAAPAPWPARTGALDLAVEPIVLANGLRVFIVERPDVPLVSLIYANRGREYRAGVTPGLATLTGYSLLEGTLRQDGQTFSGLRVGGVEPNVVVSPSGTQVGFSIVNSGAETAIGLLAEIVEKPALDERSLIAAKTEITNEVFDDDASLFGLANTLATRAALGDGHPLGIQPRDYVAALRTIDAQAVRDFYRLEYRPETSALVVVGDVDAERILEIVTRHFGSWSPVAPTAGARAASGVRELDARTPPSAIGRSRRRVYALLAGGDQAYILFPQPAVPARHRDRIALQLLADVMAGGFSSRANLVLRHGAGLTYGVSTAFRGGGDASYLQISSAVEAEEVASGVRELDAVLQRLRDEPVSRAELAAARTRYLAAFEVGTNGGVANLLASLFLSKLPASWLRNLEAEVERIEPEDLQRVANTYLRPEGDLVVLGNYYENLEELRSLGRVLPFSRPR